jgi:hypothetical protein
MARNSAGPATKHGRMSAALHALENFLALSEAMAGAAEAHEWEDLARIGAERDRLSKDLFANAAARWPVAEQASARALLERCQQLDSQILTLTEERQKALRVLLRVAKP